MDALPPSALPPGGLPQPYVDPETYSAYVAEANSFAAERVATAEANETRWRNVAYAGILMGFMGAAAALVTTARHTEHWGLLAYDTATGFMGLVKPVQDVAATLPETVDNWFIEHYVEMREGFDPATVDSTFQTVACMSDEDEQRRFSAWYNSSPSAPQQMLARSKGFRTATVTSAPAQVGGLPNGARRVAIPFRYADSGPSGTGPVKTGTAYLTVRKDLKAVFGCDPDGLVMSDYQRDLDKGE